MDTAADRLEFAPPPQPGRWPSFVLAVLAHALLVLALMHGLRWTRESQDAAVEAELWSAVPQAAPRPEPVPPPAPPQPPPQPVVKAPPEPPANHDAEIALEREKQKRLLEQQRHDEELQRQRAERAQAEAQKKRDDELARKKQEQAKQLADAKRKADDEKEKERKAAQQQQAVLDERKRQLLREENLKRMQGMAGTGPSTATGTAARSAGPSGSWQGRIQAVVRPKIHIDPATVPGNPQADVEVRIGPGGLILGKPKLVKSSGYTPWDDAVLRALENTVSLPPDIDGRYPSPVIIGFRPHT